MDLIKNKQNQELLPSSGEIKKEFPADFEIEKKFTPQQSEKDIENLIPYFYYDIDDALEILKKNKWPEEVFLNHPGVMSAVKTAIKDSMKMGETAKALTLKKIAGVSDESFRLIGIEAVINIITSSALAPQINARVKKLNGLLGDFAILPRSAEAVLIQNAILEYLQTDRNINRAIAIKKQFNLPKDEAFEKKIIVLFAEKINCGDFSAAKELQQEFGMDKKDVADLIKRKVIEFIPAGFTNDIQMLMEDFHMEKLKKDAEVLAAASSGIKVCFDKYHWGAALDIKNIFGLKEEEIYKTVRDQIKKMAAVGGTEKIENMLRALDISFNDPEIAPMLIKEIVPILEKTDNIQTLINFVSSFSDQQAIVEKMKSTPNFEDFAVDKLTKSCCFNHALEFLSFFSVAEEDRKKYAKKAYFLLVTNDTSLREILLTENYKASFKFSTEDFGEGEAAALFLEKLKNREFGAAERIKNAFGVKVGTEQGGEAETILKDFLISCLDGNNMQEASQIILFANRWGIDENNLINSAEIQEAAEKSFAVYLAGKLYGPAGQIKNVFFAGGAGNAKIEKILDHAALEAINKDILEFLSLARNLGLNEHFFQKPEVQKAIKKAFIRELNNQKTAVLSRVGELYLPADFIADPEVEKILKKELASLIEKNALGVAVQMISALNLPPAFFSTRDIQEAIKSALVLNLENDNFSAIFIIQNNFFIGKDFVREFDILSFIDDALIRAANRSDFERCFMIMEKFQIQPDILKRPEIIVNAKKMLVTCLDIENIDYARKIIKMFGFGEEDLGEPKIRRAAYKMLSKLIYRKLVENFTEVDDFIKEFYIPRKEIFNDPNCRAQILAVLSTSLNNFDGEAAFMIKEYFEIDKSTLSSDAIKKSFWTFLKRGIGSRRYEPVLQLVREFGFELEISGSIEGACADIISEGDLVYFMEIKESFGLGDDFVAQLKDWAKAGFVRSLNDGYLYNAAEIYKFFKLQMGDSDGQYAGQFHKLLMDDPDVFWDFIRNSGLSSDLILAIDTVPLVLKTVHYSRLTHFLGVKEAAGLFPKTLNRIQEFIFDNLEKDASLAIYFLEDLSSYYQEPWAGKNAKKAVIHYSSAKKFAADIGGAPWENEEWAAECLKMAETVILKNEKQLNASLDRIARLSGKLAVSVKGLTKEEREGALALGQEAKRLRGETLKKVSEALGSNPGGWYQDRESGKKYYIKLYKDENQARIEYIVNQIYKKLGISAPNSQLLNIDGALAIASEEISGTGQAPALALKNNADVRSGFVADAYLGNWDVVGLNYDNIVIDAHSRAHRIDNGGALIYRAQGAKKDFSENNIPELTSMMSNDFPSGNVFGGLNEKELKMQAEHLLRSLSEEDIDKILESSGIEKELKNSLSSVLKGRRRALEKRFDIRRADKKQKRRRASDAAGISIERLKKSDEASGEKIYPSVGLRADGDSIENQQINIVSDYARKKYLINFKLTENKYQAHIDTLKNSLVTTISCVGVVGTAYYIKYKDFVVKIATGKNLQGDTINSFKSLVQIEAPMEETEIEEFLNKELPGILQKIFSISDGNYLPSVEEEEEYKRARYAWHHKSAPAAGIEKKLTAEEVMPGYWTFKETDKHKEYLGISPFAIYHRIANTDNIADIIKAGGLLCSHERFRRGILQRGISSNQDLTTGGADSIFTRVITRSVSSRFLESSDNVPPYSFVFHPRITDRTDWYAYRNDQYGSTDPQKFIFRLPPAEVFSGQANNYSSDNEQMFRFGIALKDIKAIACSDEKQKNILLEKLKRKGIMEINSRPVEEFLVVARNFDEMINVSVAD